jgi:hypothetical protein
MLSWHLMWEHTPPGGVHPGEQTCSLSSPCQASTTPPQPYDEHSHLCRKTIVPRYIQCARRGHGSARAPKKPLFPGLRCAPWHRLTDEQLLQSPMSSIERCSPAWSCQWAALTILYVPLEHFAPRNVHLSEACAPTWDASWTYQFEKITILKFKITLSGYI